MDTNKFVTYQDFLNLPIKLKEQIFIKLITLIEDNDFETCFRLLQSSKVMVYIIQKTDTDTTALIDYFLSDNRDLFSKTMQENMKKLFLEEIEEITRMILSNPVPN